MKTIVLDLLQKCHIKEKTPALVYRHVYYMLPQKEHKLTQALVFIFMLFPHDLP